MSRKKIAIITGATSGFGNIFANIASEKFFGIQEFWLIGRNTEKLKEMEMSFSKETKILPLDLSDTNELKKIKKLLSDENPQVKILVNSAGFGITGHVEDQDEEDIVNMIDVNCRALTYLCRICIPYMTKGSRIVNFASVAAFMPQPSFAVYAASKSYVLSFTRALNCELADKDIFATAVCPGPADTNFFQTAEQKGAVRAGKYKEWFMVQPEPVVRMAIKDMMQKKEMSVYSIPMKGLKVATKVLPRKLIFGFLK